MPHHRELQQEPRRAIGIGAGINQDKGFVGTRHDRGDGRPFHSAERAQLQGGRHHHRPGIASRNNGLGLAFTHQIHGAADRGIFFAANGLRRSLIHPDHFRSMPDLDGRRHAFEHLQFTPNGQLIAHQDNGINARQRARRLHRASHHRARCEIPSHGINGYTHNTLYFAAAAMT